MIIISVEKGLRIQSHSYPSLCDYNVPSMHPVCKALHHQWDLLFCPRPDVEAHPEVYQKKVLDLKRSSKKSSSKSQD